MKHLFIAVLALSFFTPRLLAETYEADWSILDPGSPPRIVDSILRMRFSSLPPGSSIVNSETDPKNPFEDTKAALHVLHADPNDSWFRQHIRIFENISKTKGSISVQFRLVNGVLRFQVGHAEKPWDASDKDSYWMTSAPFFNVTIVPGRHLNIAGKNLRTDSVETLEPGQNYTLTISWDFADSGHKLLFSLNDQPLNMVAGSMFALPFSEENASQGINALRISLGESGKPEGEFFVGKIVASTSEQ